MNVLAIDVGGTNVKLLASGHETRRKFPSGPTMTAQPMVDEARKTAADWEYDVVSIGYPGRSSTVASCAEPHNLGEVGRASTSKRLSIVPSRSSTTRRCKHWAAIRVAACCSSVWAPG